MGKEIERKFKLSEENLKEILELECFEEKEVSQNYLSVKRDEEIRVRYENESGKRRYELTFKKGKGLVREETNNEISESMYYDLTDKIGEWPIKKNRKFFKYQDLEIMLDEYSGKLHGLLIAEIEFETEEAALSFEVPKFLGVEVTEDNKYKNKNLWTQLNKSEDIVLA